MKKELEDAIKTLDLLNLELEDIQNRLMQNQPFVSNNDNYSDSKISSLIKDLKNENNFLQKELFNHKEFLRGILESIENIVLEVKELRDNE